MPFDDRILRDDDTGLSLDLTDAPPVSSDGLEAALAAMSALEEGAIANPDEGRMVGHYWLRAPQLAPTPEIRRDIESCLAQIRALDPGDARHVLQIGIGGSALGPMLVDDCLRSPRDRARLTVMDNCDPEGMQRLLSGLDLSRTIALVVSKSGGTIETRNGMWVTRDAFRARGLSFEEHAIAITMPGSALEKEAARWRDRVPMWDWVGGRTSVTSAVGLVAMQLCGQDWEGFLKGAATADVTTRRAWADNPAALLAAAWRAAGGGKRAIVFEPYRDRYALLSRYFQQLFMESLGKTLDRKGRTVHAGLAVYGNKGSTDQHAYVQQLRDGLDNSFVHFIETIEHAACPLEDGTEASDHLTGFLRGTRRALAEAGRPSATLLVPDASPRTLGALVAIFERAVGLYAELIDINAYHQPGVEAGKKAAKDSLAALARMTAALGPNAASAQELADTSGTDPILAWRLLTHLAATGRAVKTSGKRPSDDRFTRK